jgi:hypothetical protein
VAHLLLPTLVNGVVYLGVLCIGLSMDPPRVANLEITWTRVRVVYADVITSTLLMVIIRSNWTMKHNLGSWVYILRQDVSPAGDEMTNVIHASGAHVT